MTILSKVIAQLEDQKLKTGNHCGLYLGDFKDVELTELKKALRELFNQRRIKVREGIHGKLIMLR